MIPGTAGNVDDSVGFRAARADDMTTGQVKFKADLQDDINLIGVGSVLPNYSEDGSLNNLAGAGDNKPDFNFLSLVPKYTIQGPMFDSMVVSTDELPKLSGQRWKFMEKVERESGCHIRIPGQDYQSQPVRGIRLFGTEAGVAKAKKVIQDRLVNQPLFRASAGIRFMLSANQTAGPPFGR